MEIKSTRNYSLFKKLDGNRDVKRTNALVKSIKDLDLTMYSPIIVTDDYRIVDGQHRFEACKNLCLPIHFVVMDSTNAERAMITLNKFQSQWRNEEFFQYDVKKVGGVYSELKEYIEKYKIQLSFAVLLFPEKPFETSKVRDDKFSFTKYEHCDELADFYLREEFRRLPFWKTKPFVRAIRCFYEDSDEKQRGKLLRKALAIPHCANHTQYNVAFWNLLKMRR